MSNTQLHKAIRKWVSKHQGESLSTAGGDQGASSCTRIVHTFQRDSNKLHTKDSTGHTPLQLAVAAENFPTFVLRMFVASVQDYDLQGSSTIGLEGRKWFILHECLKNSSSEAFKVLIHKFPNFLLQQDDDGRLPLHLLFGNQTCADKFCERDVPGIQNCFFPPTITLSQKELMARTRDRDGLTPLHVFATRASSYQCKLLYDLIALFPGAIDVPDSFHFHPVHYAIMTHQYWEKIYPLLRFDGPLSIPIPKLMVFAVQHKAPLLVLQQLEFAAVDCHVPYWTEQEVDTNGSLFNQGANYDEKEERTCIHWEVAVKPVRRQVLEWLCQKDPASIAVPDPETGLSPLLTAASQDLSLGHLLVMLREYPSIIQPSWKKLSEV